MSRFNQVLFLGSAARAAQFPADVGVEVGFVGRSNAGKSSAINAITQRQGLARTSKTPGRTQLLNFFELAPGRRLVDLPGYGYAEVTAAQRRAWQPLIEALHAREALRGLFVIVDARRGIQDGDEALLEWAGPQRRLHVLLAKCDKLSTGEGRATLRAAEAALKGRSSVQLFSSLKGTGVAEAREILAAWLGV